MIILTVLSPLSCSLPHLPSSGISQSLLLCVLVFQWKVGVMNRGKYFVAGFVHSLHYYTCTNNNNILYFTYNNNIFCYIVEIVVDFSMDSCLILIAVWFTRNTDSSQSNWGSSKDELPLAPSMTCAWVESKWVGSSLPTVTPAHPCMNRFRRFHKLRGSHCFMSSVYVQL